MKADTMYILEECQKMVKEKHDLDIGLKEIDSMIQSQYECVIICVKKGLNITLPKFGSFLNAKQRALSKQKKEDKEYIKEMSKTLSPIEILEKETELSNKRQELRKEAKATKVQVLTFEDLLKHPLEFETEGEIEKILNKVQTIKKIEEIQTKEEVLTDEQLDYEQF